MTTPHRTVDPITERQYDDGAGHVLHRNSGGLILNRYLSANGDGTGNKNFVGDYSAAQGVAYIQPGADETFYLARMIVLIQDGVGFAAVKYGAINGGLTNGVQVRVQDDSGTIVDFTNGVPIVNNASWAGFCYDADVKAWGVGDEFLPVRWTFQKSGVPIKLDGSKGARLEVLFDDDLTDLVAHRFLVQGTISDEYF
jgi:hypothetical protein